METQNVTTDQSLTQINGPRPEGAIPHETVNQSNEPIATGSTPPPTPLATDGYTLTRVTRPSKEETMQAEREERLRKLAEACCVDMGIELPEDDALLAVTDPVTGKDVPLCTSEDLVTIKAAPKNGKSTLMSIFVAAILVGQWHKVKSFVKHGSSTLYIDTEMKTRDTQRMGRMALTMAGKDANVNPEGFYYYNMRRYSPEEIIEMTEFLIQTLKPQVVFIDGSLDLINNFNDPEESQRLVKGYYLRWIDTYHITIITAIHTNKTNDTHASQGHLGAMLDKKGEITLECSRQKDSPFITVSAPTCRHTQVPAFSFMHDDNGMPTDCDQELAEYQAEQKRVSQQKKEERELKALNDLKQKVATVMADTGVEGMSRQTLVKRLMSVLELGISSVQAKVKTLTEIGFLTATGYNGNLVLATVEQQGK